VPVSDELQVSADVDDVSSEQQHMNRREKMMMTKAIMSAETDRSEV
jgi:hypothetical protein